MKHFSCNRWLIVIDSPLDGTRVLRVRPVVTTGNQPFNRPFANYLAFLFIMAASLGSQIAQGQVLWSSAGGSAWLTGTNWTGSAVPTAAQIAQFGANPTASGGVGINFNATTNAGVQTLGNRIQEVGAIDITPARAAAHLVGNSSATAGATGTLSLSGVTVNGVSNTIIRNASNQPFTIQNTQSTGNQTMGVSLGNITENVINIDGTGNITILSIISGSGRNLTLNGSSTGTLRLNGANTYTGATKINSSTLVLGVTNALSSASNVLLNGGTLSTGGAFNQNVGTLTLSTNSSMALDPGAHMLMFAASNGVTWTGTTLTVTGWTGTAGASGTAGKLFVGTDASGLTAVQLAKISFTGYSAGASILSTGEVVPAPACAQTVTNTNTGATFCTIQAAVDAPATLSGHTINVGSGTYNEQVSIGKSLTIIGVGATKPVLNFTGTPALANGHPTIFDITTANVRIENLAFDIDLTKLNSAILASAVNISNLAVVNNTINPYRSGAITSSFGNRNAISINYGGPTSYRINGSNSSGLLIQGNAVSYNNNASPADASDDAGFRAGVATDEGGGSFTGNTIQATSADILVRFAQNGAVSITNNNFTGFGLELADFNAGATSLMITGNTFNGTFGSPFTSSLRLKNNTNSIPTTVANNTFTGHNLGINLENYQAVTVDNNTFTPAANSTTYRHIVENTKEGSSSSGFFTPMVSLTLTRNTFNGSGAAGGIGLGFYNQDNDSPVFGTFTLGTPGNENNFTSGLGTFIYLDNATGTANPNATPVAPWATNLNAANNKFDAGNGLKLASALTAAERATLETKLFHKPDDAQLGLISYFNPVHNVTQNTYFNAIQPAIDAANANDVIELAEFTFNERVTIDKPLSLTGASKTNTIIDGTGLSGTGSGIALNSGVTNVTIKNLTVRNFTGASPNSNAGIYGALSNSNLLVDNVQSLSNVGGAGFYANGPVQGVTITNSTFSGHTGGARGIVIWNGFKQNIVISNNIVSNNNCCGIELQDGTASGVTITGNTVSNNADNGIGVVGLKAGAGPTLIANNVLNNNGRFGIEIKNPNGTGFTSGDGSIVIENNTVSFAATAGMNNRDHAGISVYRRAFLVNNSEGYPDVPTGVVIRNNNVSGYQHLNQVSAPTESEGFGIVIEGTNHSVTGNTLNNNNIGVQQQGGGHTNANYVMNNSGDGDQAAGQSPGYFGRGNATVACGNTVSGNNFSGNTTDTRNAGPGAGKPELVKNLTTGSVFCTIQSAVDAATAGNSLSVSAGTYDELVTVNKALTIQGTGAGSNVTFTGTVPGSTLASLFTVAASDVTIQNLGFTVDLSKTHSAIHTTGDNRTNLQIIGNTITPTGTPAGSYGRRNAIAINPNIAGIPGYAQDGDGFAGVVVKGNTVNINAGGIGTSFRAAVQMDLCGGTIGGSNPADGNTFTSINHDVNVRFSNQGPVTIQNNTSLGGGIQFAEPNPGAGLITIANNTLTGATVQPATGQLGTGALMRIQNNTAGTTVSIANNGFTNYRWAMSVENFNTVTLSGNTFTPLANSTDYRSISFNTKLLATTPSASVPPVLVGATLTNNTFNGSGAAGGTGIAFFNHRQDGANPSIGNYVLGTTGNENTFNAGIATFLRLDNSTGPSSGFTSPFNEYTVSGAPSTTMNYWTPDLNATNNKFDVGSGAKLPSALSSAERMTLDGQLFDKNDDANVGRILYFFPVRNLTQNTDFPTIQSAVDAANAGDVLSAAAGTYPEAVTVNKSLTIRGANTGVSGFGSRAAESIIDGAGTRTGLVVSANNVVIDGFKFIAGQGTYGAAVAFNGPQTGVQIINNIFTDNVIGVVEPTANAAIKHNLFDGNNRAGAAGGSGIYTDVPTNGLSVEDNEFKNHTNNSAVVFGASVSNTHQNLSFIKNYIHDNNASNSMVYCVAVSGGTFSQNTITQPGTTAIKFAGANTAILVSNNFLDNNGVGVRIADDGFGLGGNTGIEIHNNSLSNNTNKAIDNQEAPTINATCNWYGTTNVDAQAGTLFGGAVTYSPYLSTGTDNEAGTPGFQPVPGSCTSTLSLAFTASPDMLLTSGTTTLSAVVSGGNTPYTYVFSGPGTISQTPGSNTASVTNIPAGVQTFTVVASDATSPTAQTISGTVNVTVTQVNTAPVATANANQTATVGQAFSYTVNAFTDAETPNNLTYTASINPANGFSFDAGTRVISGTPSMSGVSSVTVTATDPGSLSASTNFTITVSPAPVIPLALTVTASPNMILTSGTTTLSATVSGGTTPYSYTFSGPGTITPNGNTATVSNLMAGVQTFTVVASDATSPTAQTISGTVSVTVTEANTPPVATANANQTATVGQTFSYTVNAFTDAETPNNLTYTASINPANGFSFDAGTRVISGTPSMSGVSSVTVTATDPGSLSASTSFTITVSPAGTPPPTATFSITGVTTVSCETISAGLRRVTFNPRYAGLNGTPVSFSVVNELTPTTNPGPYTLNLYTDNPVITLSATQSGANTLFAYNWLSACSSSTANTPPTVANPVSPQSATVGIGYTLSLANVFTDAETPNSLVLSVTGLPAGLNFVAPSTISGTPSMSGVSTVTVTATDPGSMSASTSFIITVNPAAGTPPPPTGTFSITGVTTVSCTTLSVGLRQVSFTPRYAGTNGAPISFSVVNELAPTTNPGPYTLNLYTDNPVITLSAVQSGISSTFAYNWLASCGGSNPPANTPPTVANPVPPQSATVGIGYTLSLANVFTDAETPNQLSLAVSGLPAGLVFTAPSTISGTPSMSGVSTVTVTATDPGSMSASTSFTITVNPAAGTPPPTGTFSITGVTTVNCQVISAGERRVSFTPRYAGLDGSPVSFSVVNEMLPTTNPGPYTLNLYTDNPVITLSAVQSGVSSTFAYNWLAACTPNAPSARVSVEPVSELRIQVLGNPVSNRLDVVVTGAAGSSLNLILTDEQGHRVNQFTTEQALSSQRVQFEVGHLPAGILLLRASTPTQNKTIRVLKSN